MEDLAYRCGKTTEYEKRINMDKKQYTYRFCAKYTIFNKFQNNKN